MICKRNYRTRNIRISYAELRNTYVELRMNIRNICRFYVELRIAMRNYARNSGHAEFFPHQLLEKIPHQCGKFAEISDLVFLLCGKMRTLLTSTNFAAENILEKFLVRKFWT